MEIERAIDRYKMGIRNITSIFPDIFPIISNRLNYHVLMYIKIYDDSEYDDEIGTTTFGINYHLASESPEQFDGVTSNTMRIQGGIYLPELYINRRERDKIHVDLDALPYFFSKNNEKNFDKRFQNYFPVDLKQRFVDHSKAFYHMSLQSKDIVKCQIIGVFDGSVVDRFDSDPYTTFIFEINDTILSKAVSMSKKITKCVKDVSTNNKLKALTQNTPIPDDPIRKIIEFSGQKKTKNMKKKPRKNITQIRRKKRNKTKKQYEI